MYVYFDFKFNNTNSRIKCKTCSKLTIETIDIILVSFLFTLKIFDTFFIEHVNDRSRSPLTFNTKLYVSNNSQQHFLSH